jgi:hypothetical protein
MWISRYPHDATAFVQTTVYGAEHDIFGPNEGDPFDFIVVTDSHMNGWDGFAVIVHSFHTNQFADKPRTLEFEDLS